MIATKTGTIECVVGDEQHTSNWGKYYVKGLEAYLTKDADCSRYDKHHTYTNLFGRVPIGTVFTIFEQSGDKRGTGNFHFQICQVIEGCDDLYVDRSSYGSGYCQGSFKVITHGVGLTRGPRLLNWWTNKPSNVDLLAYALHCRQYINKRGMKELPPMPEFVQTLKAALEFICQKFQMHPMVLGVHLSCKDHSALDEDLRSSLSDVLAKHSLRDCLLELVNMTLENCDGV